MEAEDLEKKLIVQINDTKCQSAGIGVGLGNEGASVRATAEEEPVELTQQQQREKSIWGCISW